MKTQDYACDWYSPAQHAALILEKHAPHELSVNDIAKDYEHVNVSDLQRIRRYERCESDDAAVRWLINHVLHKLAGTTTSKLICTEGRWRYADGVTFRDLRLHGRKLQRPKADIHARLRDPFNPQSGAFSDNIRESLGDLYELRESMREFGWIAQFPALKDERGAVLVGHRRLAVADELGIQPVVEILSLGDGDAADAERVKLALVSNVGFKPMNKADRTRIAQYLYNERDWTMTQIAEALRVTQQQVSLDLSGLQVACNPDKSRRGGSGRTKLTDDVLAAIRERELEHRATGRSFNHIELAAQLSGLSLNEWMAIEKDKDAERPAGWIGKSTVGTGRQMVRGQLDGQNTPPSPSSPSPSPSPKSTNTCEHCGSPMICAAGCENKNATVHHLHSVG